MNLRANEVTAPSPHEGHIGCHADPERFLAMAAEFDRAASVDLAWETPRRLTHPLLWCCRAEAFHPHVLNALDGSVIASIGSTATLAAIAASGVAEDLARGFSDSAISPARDEGSATGHGEQTILVGGTVFTADDEQPWAEAVAYEGERILEVGSRTDLVAAYPLARLVDVQGGVVIPGLNDAHLHHTPDPIGVRLQTDSLLDPSLRELQAALADAVAKTPIGTWILGTMGMALTVDESLDRDLLDQIAPEHMVALLGMTNHNNVFNTAALDQLGVDDDAPDVLGGSWRRDADGRLTGRVDEYAQWRPQRTLAAMTSVEHGAASVRALSEACVQFGVTTIQNMSWTPPDHYLDMVRIAATPLRIRVIDFPASGAAARDSVPAADRRVDATRSAGPRVTRSGRKWILDGTPVEWASDFGDPYIDGHFGTQNFPLTEVEAMLQESVDADDQVLLHAIGTATVRTVVRALEGASDVDWASRLLRIEHGDGGSNEDIEALHRFGAMVVANPSHFLVTDMYTERLGPGHQISPLRSMFEIGIPVGIGSDGPLNPFFGMFAALAHPTRMTEAVDAATFLRAHTIGSARAEGADHEKGMLRPNYLADIAVLDRDVFSLTGPEIMDTRSKLTIIGGEIVHSTL